MLTTTKQITEQEKENIIKWNPSKKNFLEVYYIKWNDLENNTAGWIRYTLINSTTKASSCALWGIFIDKNNPSNNVAIKESFPIQEIKYSKERFMVSINGYEINHNRAVGRAKDNKNSMSWDLKPANDTDEGIMIRHIPKIFYGEKSILPVTKFVAPRCWYRLNGEVELNGKKIQINNAYAQQAHVFGTKLVDDWIWGSCNSFEEDTDFCFEAVVGHMSMGPVKLPELLYFFYKYEGKLYEINNALTCGFHNKSKNDFTHWEFESTYGDIKFNGEANSNPDDMICHIFHQPTTENLFAHTNYTASLKITVSKKINGNWEKVNEYNCKSSATFEVCQPKRDERVKWSFLK